MNIPNIVCKLNCQIKTENEEFEEEEIGLDVEKGLVLKSEIEFCKVETEKDFISKDKKSDSLTLFTEQLSPFQQDHDVEGQFCNVSSDIDEQEQLGNELERPIDVKCSFNQGANGKSKFIAQLPQKRKKTKRATKSGRFTCAACEKYFVKKYLLIRHIQSVHENIKSYKCSICEKSYYHKSHLVNHLNAVHEKVRHKCTECGRTFAWARCLITHINCIHKKLELCQCPECKVSFATKSTLARHFRSVHEKLRHKCSLCEMTFSFKEGLGRHIQVVHYKMTSQRPQKCSLCGLVCSRKEHLDRHILTIHKNLKTFKCYECDRAFSQKSTLLFHIQSIHENLHHECSECGKSYKDRWYLKKHMSSIHGQ